MTSVQLAIGPDPDNGESIGLGFGLGFVFGVGRPLICDNRDASVPAWMDPVSIAGAHRSPRPGSDSHAR